MQYLIKKLKEPWSIYRWLRLGLGFYFLYEAVNRDHLLAGAFGVLMLIQVAINSKCLPCEITGTCAPNSKPSDLSKTDDISYEEVK